MAFSATEPLIAFYGDDNTGSTDSMEALAKNGVNTVLFLHPPGPGALERFPDARAVGVAGMTRAMAPDALAEELGRALRSLKALSPKLCHYKVCSTFDSSPTVGSIGRGIEVGMEVFGTRHVPLLVGAPILKRYTLFGNLFATVGIETFRIDQHPTMSRHPITPMNEGDLRRHLALQTNRKVGLMDILALDGTNDAIDTRWDAICDAGNDIVLLDVLDDVRLEQAGRLIWRAAQGQGSLFVAGSSGVEYAAVLHWRKLGLVPVEPPARNTIGSVVQTLVVSGSCSPVTRGQLDHVLDGLPESERYVGIDVQVVALLDPDRSAAVRDTITREALAQLDRGRSVVLLSARGPDDARIADAAKAWLSRHPDTTGLGAAIGRAQGDLMRAILGKFNAETRRCKRVIVAGGDTSGHCARALGVEALQMIAPTAPGSPLCRASSADAQFDGIEIVLKGGQVGTSDFFERVRTGMF